MIRCFLFSKSEGNQYEKVITKSLWFIAAEITVSPNRMKMIIMMENAT